VVSDARVEELEAELGWLTAVLDRRFRAYFAGPADPPLGDEPPPPDLAGSTTPWAALVHEHASDRLARLALVLALAPHLRPQLLDVFFTKNATFDRRFAEFGGVRHEDDFEPTGETLAFVAGGGSVASRVAVAGLLEPDRPLLTADILRVASGRDTSPMKAPLRVSPEILGLVTTGRRPRPALGPDFPAHRLDTAQRWDDLVLHPATLAQIREIETFLTHGHTLLDDWGMAARLRPGHRALFHGPPGTGKTLSAALLGQRTGREVYRIDLSLVVSKYIGETEKNLSRVFDRAQQREWILFFDEADALFGKRGETKDAHDRYANQEVAFLLQRVETFDGVVILASNLRENLDDAFMRRFESVVYFPVPRVEERLRLWRRAFSPRAKLEVDLEALARRHELSGGAIVNVVRRVSLAAIAEGERTITHDDVERAVRRELNKEGRVA
jgi:histone H3/H4